MAKSATSQKLTREPQETCGSCSFAHKSGTALVCFGGIPACVVVDGKPVTMRPAIQPDDPRCVYWAANRKTVSG